MKTMRIGFFVNDSGVRSKSAVKEEGYRKKGKARRAGVL